jgi:hypothetical protein
MRTMQGPHASVARHVPAFKRDGLPRSRIATGPDLARPSISARFPASSFSVSKHPEKSAVVFEMSQIHL